jgi:hypothetical protein
LRSFATHQLPDAPPPPNEPPPPENPPPPLSEEPQPEPPPVFQLEPPYRLLFPTDEIIAKTITEKTSNGKRKNPNMMAN